MLGCYGGVPRDPGQDSPTTFNMPMISLVADTDRRPYSLVFLADSGFPGEMTCMAALSHRGIAFSPHLTNSYK